MNIVSLYDAIDGVVDTPSSNSLALASFFVSPCNKLQVHVVSRQIGTSTTIALSAAVDAINSPNKVICILGRYANRLTYIERIRDNFSQFIDIPNNRTEIRFLNNSRIIFRSIDVQAMRGMTIHRVYMDAEVCDSTTLSDIMKVSLPTLVSTNGKMNICINYHTNTAHFIDDMKNSNVFVMEYPQFDKQHMIPIIGITSYNGEYLCKGV